jgi:hypothetical protein
VREVARGEGRGQQEEEKEQEAAPTKGVYPASANREANKRIPKLMSARKRCTSTRGHSR